MSISGYLLSVTTASIISAIVCAISENLGKSHAVVKLLCGIFLSVVIASPLTAITIPNLSAYFDDLHWDAASITQQADAYRTTSLRSGIKAAAEAYILDKAMSMAAFIDVEVTLNDDDLPVPCAVRISGNVSPYVRQHLQSVIENDLGIPKEVQEWNG